TRFFGREEEIERLGKMLSTPRTRLVTLTGPGGTGKTRLALEAAAHLVEGTQDAPSTDVPTCAVFVSLASITESERLFEVILRSLGVVPVPNQGALAQLASALEARPHTLLVLDNFEQLVGDGALRVHDLLAQAASVKVLVTSRQRLHIEGEREFHLAPLPTSAGEQTLEALLGIPSIALFVDRAQTTLPDFQLTERNAEVVSQLCDYLEGLPLTIELAAVRVALLTPARILEQVQANRLDFLATRRRDAASRQKTLRATLDWSYTLLPEAARSFLVDLSVFQGGWTLKAAAAICALSEAETLDWLTLLRDSSLLVVSDTDEGMRFTLLETIREYSQEKLQERGEDSAVRRRHRDYFVEYLKQAEPELSGPDQALWLNCLQIDHDNLCAAIEWSETDAASAQVGLWLTGALSRFWDVRGYLCLGRGYLAKALSRADASAPTLERAKALQGAGSLARSQGDFASARALLEESLTILRALGDKGGIALSLNNLGNVASNQGDYGAARTLYEESLVIQRELGDNTGIARSLSNLGNMAYAQGDYGAARPLYEESLVIRRELGDKTGIARSLHSLGNMAYARGDYATARTLYEESLVIRRELGDKAGISHSLTNLGVLAHTQDDKGAAGTLYEESLIIRRELGDKRGITESLTNLGTVAQALGDYGMAKSLYEESLTIQRELGYRAGIAESLFHLGNMFYTQSDYATARMLLDESLTIRRELGDRAGIGHSLTNLGNVARAQGDYGTAKSLYEESLSLRREMGDLLTTAGSLEDFANLAGWQGQFERAVRLLGAAEALRASLGRTLPVGLAAEYQRTVDAAHAALSEEAFAATWEEGRAMTLEQAVAYALEEGATTT
ncbi:MAG: transcriptional activator domain protein, partial [Chthonomonadaceae bacterium]|nr:transcriptional activator domain protein [Chthonomonadaceae bacterium]